MSKIEGAKDNPQCKVRPRDQERTEPPEVCWDPSSSSTRCAVQARGLQGLIRRVAGALFCCYYSKVIGTRCECKLPTRVGQYGVPSR
jgi:hypothetical protein